MEHVIPDSEFHCITIVTKRCPSIDVISRELIPKLRTSQKTEVTNLMFRIKLPQRKRCYPLLFPINTGAFSTWSIANCSPTRKYYYGTEGLLFTSFT